MPAVRLGDRARGDANGMRLLCATLLAVPALAGCAGGGGDDRLSREEFVERATAICMRAEERIAELEEPASVAGLGDYAREARAITEEGVSELRELEPPEELEAGFRRYLESGDEVVALLGELEDAASAGDEAGARQVAEEIAESADAQGAARAAGIPGCESTEEG